MFEADLFLPTLRRRLKRISEEHAHNGACSARQKSLFLSCLSPRSVALCALEVLSLGETVVGAEEGAAIDAAGGGVDGGPGDDEAEFSSHLERKWVGGGRILSEIGGCPRKSPSSGGRAVHQDGRFSRSRNCAGVTILMPAYSLSRKRSLSFVMM